MRAASTLCKAPLRGQLRQKRCLERREFLGILVAADDEFLGAKKSNTKVMARRSRRFDFVNLSWVRFV
jgi:chorismate-pyruvate lyase